MTLPGGYPQLLDVSRGLLPELILFFGAVAVLVLGFFPGISRRWLTGAAAAALAASGVAALAAWPTDPRIYFFEMLRLDEGAAALRVMMSVTGLLVVAMPQTPRTRVSEYLFLILLVALGGNLLVMSIDFLAALLALELISLSSYALVGFSFSRAAAEGAWKYFLIGSAATAITVFGMSYVFGATGSTAFTSPAFAESARLHPSALLEIGTLLTLTGFLFKIAAAPLHWWAPDTYQAAPVAVTALLSTVPKMAGMGILMRFALAMQECCQGALNLPYVLAAIALLTLLVGNLGGLLQRDARRLMAYSSIAQSGFVLVGVTSVTPEGTQAAFFYLAILAIMNLLTFWCIDRLAAQTGTFEIARWAGLGRSRMMLTAFLTIGLVALGGLPPTAGFMAKLFIFTSLWAGYQASGDILLLALFAGGLAATVAGLFFYLKAPYYLLIKSAPGSVKMPATSAGNIFIWLLAALILLLFFHPGLLMGWLNRVTFVF